MIEIVVGVLVVAAVVALYARHGVVREDACSLPSEPWETWDGEVPEELESREIEELHVVDLSLTSHPLPGLHVEQYRGDGPYK